MQKAVLGAVILCAFFTPLLRAQVGSPNVQSNSHDLSAMVNVFENYVKDFRGMEQAARGEDFEILANLENAAMIAEERVFAANAELQMYDGISCATDRMKAKRILKEQLKYYVWVFDSEVTRTNGGLTFVKAPAEAQTGLRMKDDMRATKEKFDAILASLQ